MRAGGWLARLNAGPPLGLSGGGLSALSSSFPSLTSGDDDDYDDDDMSDSDDEAFKKQEESIINALNGVIGGPIRLHAAPPNNDDTARSLRDQLDEFSKSEEENTDTEMKDVKIDGPDHDDDDDEEDDGTFGPLNPRQVSSIGSPLVPSPLALQDLRKSPTPNAVAADDPQPKQGEAPPPPKPVDAKSAEPIEQAHVQPGSDAPSGAVKVEGLMDASEAPTKV